MNDLEDGYYTTLIFNKIKDCYEINEYAQKTDSRVDKITITQFSIHYPESLGHENALNRLKEHLLGVRQREIDRIQYLMKKINQVKLPISGMLS